MKDPVSVVTSNEVTTGCEVTVKGVLPEVPPKEALMVVLPAATGVTRPLLLIVATEVSDETQVARELRSNVVPSEKLPVAVNCRVICRGMLELAGVTDMDDNVAEVTVRVVVPEVSPKLAVMVVVPAAIAVARPVLLIVATFVSDEVQTTVEVISVLVLDVSPVNVPLAENCCVVWGGMTGSVGLTVIVFGGPIPPHANRRNARDVRNNMAKIDLIFMHAPDRVLWTIPMFPG